MQTKIFTDQLPSRAASAGTGQTGKYKRVDGARTSCVCSVLPGL